LREIGKRVHAGKSAATPTLSGAPVTISVGDTCRFRFAGVDRRTAPFTDVELRSGDLLVFGGPTRLIYHGVPTTYPGTAPAGLGLPPGRVSITVRQTGLPRP
jgi:alkylated DNA repair protein (DNA oxidative demethylase)